MIEIHDETIPDIKPLAWSRVDELSKITANGLNTCYVAFLNKDYSEVSRSGIERPGWSIGILPSDGDYNKGVLLGEFNTKEEAIEEANKDHRNNVIRNFMKNIPEARDG